MKKDFIQKDVRRCSFAKKMNAQKQCSLIIILMSYADDFNIEKIHGEDPEIADKLAAALKAFGSKL